MPSGIPTAIAAIATVVACQNWDAAVIGIQITIPRP
jgi:hypothetical protein